MEFNLSLFQKNKKETISLDKEVVIDGILYQISLGEKKPKSGRFELSFHVKGTDFLINKGILQFYKLVDEIKVAVEELQQKTNVEEITFRSSYETLTLDAAEKFQQALQERFNENPSFLNGFIHETEEGIISIDNQIVTIKTPTYINPIKRIFKKDPTYFTETKPLEDIIFNLKYIDDFFFGFIQCEIVCDYGKLNINSKVRHELFSEETQLKDRGDQRNKLYQRVLERKFPDVIVQFKDPEFKLILNKKLQ